MDQLLNRLMIVLGEEVVMYRSLLAVCQDERLSLLQFDLDGISAASKKQENLILNINILVE
mgnify:CR=1 FL=1